MGITKELLEAIKLYIENMEVKVDGEWGNNRKLSELITDGEMPELYNKVCELLAK